MTKNSNVTKLSLPVSLISLLLVALPCSAEVKKASPDEVKAVVLYNFAKHVEWPESAFQNETSPIRLCLFDEDRVDTVLRGKSDLRTKARALEIENLKASDAKDIDSCHIVYWNGEERSSIESLLEETKRDKVLTVSDASEESMVKFLTKEGKVRFHINNQKVENAGLTMSPQLLALAVGGDS